MWSLYLSIWSVLHCLPALLAAHFVNEGLTCGSYFKFWWWKQRAKRANAKFPESH